MSLQFERRPHSAGQTRSAGVLSLGQRDLHPGVAQAGLPAVLHPASAITERWTSASPVRSGRQLLKGWNCADSPAARGAVYLLADVCRSELLVEIECHGDAPR